jgi:hypothetical protein
MTDSFASKFFLFPPNFQTLVEVEWGKQQQTDSPVFCVCVLSTRDLTAFCKLIGSAESNPVIRHVTMFFSAAGEKRVAGGMLLLAHLLTERLRGCNPTPCAPGLQLGCRHRVSPCRIFDFVDDAAKT